LANPRTNENLKWICRRADCDGTNQLESSIPSTISKKLDSFATKSDLISISNKISELSAEVASLHQSFSQIEPQLSVVEQDVAHLKI
ncbi:hypothetical protein J6590_031659, partial [Homalodisca vitripennis]